MPVQDHIEHWHRPSTQEEYRCIFVNGKAFIEANHRSIGLKIEQFCHNYGCSVRTAQRAFSFHGTSWHRYLRAVRMQRAAVMLANSSLSISAIGQRVGYSARPQFVRAFEKHCGISPQAFREASR